jgi:hypothetical protein
LGAAAYIAGYAISISQKRQVDVLDASWVNNIRGAAFGTVASRNTDLRLAPNAEKFRIVRSF